MDWRGWHDHYDRPGSTLARRLAVVRERIRLALDEAPPGPLRVVSMCAGQGRDLFGALAGHPRASDVAARLVELDEGNAALARRAGEGAGLRSLEVVVGDAALTRHYAGMVPAELVLACGVFGNITDEDVERTLEHCAQLCARGGTLIWTRHRQPPDLVPRICAWLAERGFEPVWLSDPEAGYGVGVHRFAAEPQPLASDARMFTFVGYDALPSGGGAIR
ncbi:SAM-dependent methyltransferase [Streptomyces sp. 6N223]|uniref:SAM-dependent methyltransferase n=1 Tax=Streptomyces sp. 6N223 TaxID=3457412 RepID=UPI003FD30248